MANPLIAQEVATINDPKASIEAKVDAAAKLWQLAEDCDVALKGFKIAVRAVARTSNQSVFVINGNGMAQCRVVTPPPALKLNEDLTIENERLALGVVFDGVYEVKLQLRKTDPAFLAAFPQWVQAHMAKVTSLVINVPRVSLKSMPGVESVQSPHDS